jgi:lipopolysaccharide assembly outer membrane protein LptD (OstA)
MNIKAEISKRENDSVVFMKSARLTTAKDIDDPEYYFYVTKVKFVPKKRLGFAFLFCRKKRKNYFKSLYLC